MRNEYIIIVTYNVITWLHKCLKSCFHYSIIIVDNASTDETVSFIEANYPDITLLKQQKNLGFGKANNLGISYALKNGCDYVFLLNQDAYLEKGAIERMIAIHKNNFGYGILSPMHLDGKGDKLDKKFSNYLRFDANNFIFRDAFKNKLNEIYPIHFVNAAAWLLPKETLQKIGGFDPIFSHYGEDDNYCQRALYHNLKIGVIPKAFVKHDRENVVKRPLDTEAKKLSNFEVQIKMKFANINIQNNELNYLIKYKLRRFLILLFKFRFKNEHHKKELYKKEFNNLLMTSFKNTELFSQTHSNGVSFILNEMNQKMMTLFSGNFSEILVKKKSPMFLVAIASDINFEKQSISIFDGSEVDTEITNKKVYAVKNSVTFKVGLFILLPIRILKKIISLLLNYIKRYE
jgi:GT2 family glycosyltransferase